VCKFGAVSGCTYKTRVKSEITDHARKEHGFDPIYVCPTCQRKFTRDRILREHMEKEHKQYVKPGPYNGLYTCKFCKENYPTRKKLNLHKKKTHKNEKEDVVTIIE
jgi:predicted small metal-binding protein